jgi:glucokinase
MSEVIGVDLGGTKVALASLAGGQLGESVLQPTADENSEALVEQLAAMIEQARGDDLQGVGIGVPSVVEFDTGRVISSANIPLADVALRDVLGERIGVPVFVDNDATVAALAEAHDENLNMIARDLVMITVGTGVGGGLVLGGRIYRGATGGAGELGHTLIGTRLDGHIPEPGDFPQRGSLEYAAAGHALDRLATECAEAEPDSQLARMRGADGEVTGEQAVQAARDGDEMAAATVEMWGERLGIGIANAINTFDPEEVVIGGGAARAGDRLLEPARRIAAGYVLPGLGSKTRIRLARHGVRAGVLGAALLAHHELGGSSDPPSNGDVTASSKVSP